MTPARDYGALRADACAWVAAGAPMQVVARELDVAFSTVQRWCAGAGVRSRWPFPLTEAARAELHRQGPDILLHGAASCHTMHGGAGTRPAPETATPRAGSNPAGGTTGEI